MSPTDTVAFESSEPLKVSPMESVVSRQQIRMWSVARAQSRVSSDTAGNNVTSTLSSTGLAEISALMSIPSGKRDQMLCAICSEGSWSPWQ